MFAVGLVIAVVAIRAGRIRVRIAPAALVEAFETGAKYALAVGAAAATVGIVIGVVTLTGVSFKLSTIITGAANAMAGGVGEWLPAWLVDPHALAPLVAHFFALITGCWPTSRRRWRWPPSPSLSYGTTISNGINTLETKFGAYGTTFV